MKLTFIISIIQLVLGCSSLDKSNNGKHTIKSNDATVTFNNSASNVLDSTIDELHDQEITITVSYAAIECGCPQWFETKFKDADFLEGVERFYLEPKRKDLINANGLWDGEHLPLNLKVTGKFSKEKLLPRTYNSKSELEKARIFWYDKIVVISPSSK